jgi:hypothetical protein
LSENGWKCTSYKNYGNKIHPFKSDGILNFYTANSEELLLSYFHRYLWHCNTTFIYSMLLISFYGQIVPILANRNDLFSFRFR